MNNDSPTNPTPAPAFATSPTQENSQPAPTQEQGPFTPEFNMDKISEEDAKKYTVPTQPPANTGLKGMWRRIFGKYK